MPLDSLNKRKMTMKTIKYIAAATIISIFSFGAFAAQPASDMTPISVKSSGVTEVEAGSNIAPGAQSTGRSMDDAFDVHTLVAGEWY